VVANGLTSRPPRFALPRRDSALFPPLHSDPLARPFQILPIYSKILSSPPFASAGGESSLVKEVGLNLVGRFSILWLREYLGKPQDMRESSRPLAACSQLRCSPGSFRGHFPDEHFRRSYLYGGENRDDPTRRTIRKPGLFPFASGTFVHTVPYSLEMQIPRRVLLLAQSGFRRSPGFQGSTPGGVRGTSQTNPVKRKEMQDEPGGGDL
jgi:hypothetical protein